MLDAGDALSPSNLLVDTQRPRIVATAELIVDQYASQGVDAMAIGDRDLALGVATLQELAARTKVPFITTNLVDAQGKPVFRPYVVIERAGMRVLVLGLVGATGQRMAALTDGWRFEPPVDAARRAIDLASQAGAVDLIVVLSQLTAPEERELNVALPTVRVFLGGDGMGVAPEPSLIGTGVSANGGQKGKQVGFLTITFSDPRGPSAPLVDPGRRASLEAKKAGAERRIANIERLIAQAKEPQPADADAGARPVRRAPVETYERQLVGARAEIQLVEQELADIAAGSEAGNQVDFELVAMDPKIEDEPITKAAVEAFRKVWPDPAKAGAPPPGPVPAPH